MFKNLLDQINGHFSMEINALYCNNQCLSFSFCNRNYFKNWNDYIIKNDTEYLYYFDQNGKTLIHDGYPNGKPTFKQGQCIKQANLS